MPVLILYHYCAEYAANKIVPLDLACDHTTAKHLIHFACFSFAANDPTRHGENDYVSRQVVPTADVTENMALKDQTGLREKQRRESETQRFRCIVLSLIPKELLWAEIW